jgi:hypothetical protein
MFLVLFVNEHSDLLAHVDLHSNFWRYAIRNPVQQRRIFTVLLAATIYFFLGPILYVWRLILSFLPVKTAPPPMRTILHR